MNNCGGHECYIELPRLHVELLPPDTTHKYQTLDLRLIAQSKLRYSSILLRKIVKNTIVWNSNEHTLPSIFNSGNWSLREVHMPHVGDVMELVNESWGKTKSIKILKCWNKSNC